MKNIVPSILAVIVIIMVGYFFFQQNESNQSSPNNIEQVSDGPAEEVNEEESTESHEKFDIVQEEEVFLDLANLIGTLHGHYNNKLGWDRHKSVNWEDFEGNVIDFLDEIQLAMEFINTPHIKNDFENIESLMIIAHFNQDVNALLYIHRIIHDLDIAYNGYKGSTFGFSIYLQSGTEVPTVTNYIIKHENYLEMYNEETE